MVRNTGGRLEDGQLSLLLLMAARLELGPTREAPRVELINVITEAPAKRAIRQQLENYGRTRNKRLWPKAGSWTRAQLQILLVLLFMKFSLVQTTNLSIIDSKQQSAATIRGRQTMPVRQIDLVRLASMTNNNKTKSQTPSTNYPLANLNDQRQYFPSSRYIYTSSSSSGHHHQHQQPSQKPQASQPASLLIRKPPANGANRHLFYINNNNNKFIRNVDSSQVMMGDQEERNTTRLVSIQNQLQALRQELELELRVTSATTTYDPSRNGSSLAGQQVTLGSACTQTGHCQRTIKNSHCKLEHFTCTCLPTFVEFNSTTCLPSTLLGYSCQIDAQCQFRVANSYCDPASKQCSCKSSFVPFRKDKCLGPSEINDFCLGDTQCQLNDRHSFCKWKIPNVYGTCKCPPNYELLPRLKSENLTVQAATTPTTPTSFKCAPRLGDTCLSDEECAWTTPNSSCQDSSPLVPTGRWLTSGASVRKCFCSQGFVAAQNQLDCIKLWPERDQQTTTTTSSTTTTTTTPKPELVDAKHHYDMLPTSSSSASDNTRGAPDQGYQLDIQLMTQDHHRQATAAAATTTPGSVTSTTTSDPSASNGTTNQPAEMLIAPVSLGKSCTWTRECQARDPYSACLNGFCECLRPSQKCSSSARGCPKDTFQCRNGQCISWYFVCDLFKNCDDGSDELDCRPGKCPREAFQCHSDGKCLTRGKICNGKRDCLDGSDELGCNGPATTTTAAAAEATTITFELAGSANISANTSPNDGPSTAGVLSQDSLTGPSCPPEAFACQDGTCLPAYVFCNAVVDCPDGSDEDQRLCERRPPKQALVEAVAAAQAPSSQQSPEVSTTTTTAGATNLANSNQISSNETRLSEPSSSLPTQTTTTTASSLQQQESPLVKTDRAAIERLLATLALSPARTPEWRGRQKQTNLESASGKFRPRPRPEPKTTRRDYSRMMPQRKTEAEAPHPVPRPLLVDHARECPRWAYTCQNGKCRSSAILCSGVDGCGDNSDELQCEVCQCEPPAPVESGASEATPRDGASGGSGQTATNRRRRTKTRTTAEPAGFGIL